MVCGHVERCREILQMQQCHERHRGVTNIRILICKMINTLEPTNNKIQIIEDAIQISDLISYVNIIYVYIQRVNKKFNESDETWYDSFSVEKNALYSIMSNLSFESNLIKRYTNHCIRATSISTLDHQRIEARHTMSVSGHKNETSIKSYSSKLGDQNKHETSDVLGKNINFSKT